MDTGWGPEIDRARDLSKAGSLDEADAIADRVLATGPSNAGAHCVRATTALQRLQFDAALAHARTAGGLAPEDAWPRRVAAVAFARLERYDEACLEADAATALAPDDARAWLARATADIACRRDSADGFPSARRALELDPDEPGAHTTLGWVLMLHGEMRAARTAFKGALRLDPDYAAGRHGLAAIDAWREHVGPNSVLEPADRERTRDIFVELPKLANALNGVMWLIVFAVIWLGPIAVGFRTSCALGSIAGALAVAVCAARLVSLGGSRTGPILRTILPDRVPLMWGLIGDVSAVVLLAVTAVAPASIGDFTIAGALVAVFLGWAVGTVHGWYGRSRWAR